MRKLTLALFATVGLVGCRGESSMQEASFDPTLGRLEAALSVGTISSGQQTILSIRAVTTDALRVVVGADCQSGTALGSPSVDDDRRASLTLSATGPLATEGEHDVHVCQNDLRATVRLRVDDTAPVATANRTSGTYCGSQRVTFHCSDCAGIAFSTDAPVSFNADGSVASGALWDGQAVFVSDATTLHFAGIDAVGNAQASTSVSLDVRPFPTYESYGIGLTSLSANPDATQQQTQLSVQTSGAATVHLRRDAWDCKSGTVIASGTVDGTGEATLTVNASDIYDNAATALAICVVSADTCVTSGDTVYVHRLDTPGSWYISWPTPGSPATPDTTWVGINAPSSITSDGSTVTAALSVDGYALGIPASVEVYGSSIEVYWPVDALPENTCIDIEVTPVGLRDAYSNPYPAFTPTLCTSARNTSYRVPNASGYTTVPFTTVIDNSTNIMWKACAEGLSDDDCTGNADNTWYNAVAACAERGSDNYAGGTRWRLPNVWELMSLVDYSAGPPYLPAGMTQNDAGITSMVWSSTRVRTDFSSYYVLDTSTGMIQAALGYNTNASAFCVNGVSGYGFPSYPGTTRAFQRVSWLNGFLNSDALGEMVLVTSARLLFQQAPARSPVEAGDADAACEGVRHGLDDWRVATPADFMALQTFSTSQTAQLALGAFTGVTIADTFWAGGVEDVFMYLYAGVELRDDDGFTPRRVWCVRDAP